MKLHRDAKTTPRSKAELVDRVERQGWAVSQAAHGAGVREPTGRKRLKRHEMEAVAGLDGRSSGPQRVQRRLTAYCVRRVLDLRRKCLTRAQIAQRFDLPRITVSRVLARHGLGRLRALQPVQPVVRYERDRPGELVHFDVKQLGRIGQIGHRIRGDRKGASRGIGWGFMHVAIDDKTRLAYSDVLPDQRGVTARGFLKRVIRWFARRGITIERALSDNGSCYRSKHFRKAADSPASRRRRRAPTGRRPTARPSASSRP